MRYEETLNEMFSDCDGPIAFLYALDKLNFQYLELTTIIESKKKFTIDWNNSFCYPSIEKKDRQWIISMVQNCLINSCNLEGQQLRLRFTTKNKKLIKATMR